MRTARLLGLSPDGRSLIVVTDAGEHVAIVADARLRAAVRGDRPRLGQLEIEMESALRPREIQTRIRAGHSLAEVAQAAGVPVERVEPYALPVLAEREHIAALAVRSTVRRRGETSGHRNLKIALDERLGARGIDSGAVHWDSSRNDDGKWAVTASYASGEASRQAVFLFDVAARFSVAGNDEARWVLGEHSAAKGPQPGRKRPTRDGEAADEVAAAEPTLDLSDELALVRAIQDDPTQLASVDDAASAADGTDDTDDADDASEADVTVLEVDVVELGQEADEPSIDGSDEEQVTYEHPPEQTVLEDFVPADDEADGAADAAPSDGPAVPDQTEMDTLYEMLDGYTEDSVRIYRGLDDSPSAGWEPEIVVNRPTGPVGLDVELDDPPSDDTSEEEEEQREGIVTPPTTNPDPIDPDKIPNTTGDEDAPAKEDAVPDAPGAPEPRDSAAVVDPDPVAPAEPDTLVDAGEPSPPPAPTSLPRKRKRASVPSWDEIMFGGPKPG